MQHMATHSTLPFASPTLARRKRKTLVSELLSVGGSLLRVLAAYAVVVLATAVWTFPYRTDEVTERGIAAPSDYDAFYKKIYAPPQALATTTEDPADPTYVRIAREAIEGNNVVGSVKDFVAEYELQNAHVLDVGAGTGYLQDVVENYVGLDISPTAARYFHKPFVNASATAMPLPDSDFDLVWSVWVLEHVPGPEQALAEMRRVVKDNGILFLVPAWETSPYQADGYPVRPFSDFNFAGKLTWLSMFVREYAPFYAAVETTQRVALRARAGLGPTRFHYRPLNANYDHYWMADSDAVNSLDRFEMSLWFTSRGDECLNCERRLWDRSGPLIIRVHKR
jgi:SAM-dependent methyltransferase